MCTVSFLPAGDRYFLTSNRDERHFRSDALPPEIHPLYSGKLLYPKDRDANGTWIALHEAGHTVIFLNGGFEKHMPSPPYKKSRGLVLLEIADSFAPLNVFRKMRLNGIEPFTAVIFEKGTLTECRWDGKNRHENSKDPSIPHIWSSVTLYEPEIIEKRNQWFADWLIKYPQPTGEDILHFHEFTGDGDGHNDLKMNRNGVVFTVSITAITIRGTEGSMEYLDLKNNKRHRKILSFQQHSPVY